MSDYSINATVGADDSGFQATFNRVTSSLASWGLSFDKLYDKTSGFFKDFGIDVDKFAGKFGMSGEMMTGIVAVGAAVVQVGSVVVGAVDEMIDAFGEYENKMAEVFTLLPDISAEAMSQMEDDVDSFSKKFGTLPNEAIPALYQAISAGIPQDNVFDFLEVAQEAAIGGVSNLKAAVDGLSSVVNAYGADVVSVQDVSDAMFIAVKDGKTTFDELAKSLYNVIPTAASAGVSFDDVAAALAAITAQGTPTTVATTQLRQMLVELNKDGSKTSDLFKEIAGESFKSFIASGNDVNDALKILEDYAKKSNVGVNDLFSSVEAGNAALQLTGKGAEKFGSVLDDMQNKAGATSKAFETMDATLETSGKKLSAAQAILTKDIGEMFAPIKGGILEGLTEVINGFDAVVIEISKIIKPLSAIIGAVFNTVLTIAGKFINEIARIFSNSTTWNLFADMVENAAVIIVNVLDDLADIFAGVFAVIGGILTGDWNRAWVGAQLVVLSAVKIILDVVSGMVNGVFILINTMIGKINPVLEKFGKSIPAIAEINLAAATGITAKISDLSDELSDNVERNTTKTEKHIIESHENITSAVEEQSVNQIEVVSESNQEQTDIVKTETEKQSDIITSSTEKSLTAYESLKKGFIDVFEDMKKDAEDWGDVASSVAGFIKGEFGATFKSLGASIISGSAAWEDWASAALSGLSNVLSALGDQLTAMAAAKLVMGDFAGAGIAAAAAAAAYVSSGLVGALADTGKEGSKAADEVERISAALDDTVESTEDFVKKWAANITGDQITESIDTLEGRIEDLKKKIEDISKRPIRPGLDGVPEQVQRLNDLVDAMKELEDAEAALADAQTYQADLMENAMNSITGSLEQVNFEIETYQQLFEGAIDTNYSYLDSLNELKKDVVSFYASLSSVGSDIGKSLIDSITEGFLDSSEDSQANFMTAMKEYIMNLVVQSAIYTQSLTEQIAQIGADIANAVAAGVTEADLQGIKARLAALFETAQTTASVAAGVVSDVFSGYATGTDYAQAGWHVVGEQGPELAYVGQGTRVFDNQETMGMIGGGTKNITANFYSPLAMNQAEQMDAWRQTSEELAFQGVI